MTRVGVIGGGQLAWMMAKEAPQEDVILIVQTPHQQDSAVSLAQDVIFAPLDSVEATAKLAQKCDVITFENEFVDLNGLQKLADQGVCFRPSLSSLAPLLDKYEQRSFLADLGLPVPRFQDFHSSQDLDNFDFPFVLKVRRHGYDGQGTIIVKSNEELKKALDILGDVPFLIEEFVPFEKELAVIVARGIAGEVVTYPVVETYQKEQICRWTIAPTDITISQQQEIRAIATKLLTALDYIGVMGIELFLTPEGKILVNETAPRTHNSGHYTLDGCHTSQFALQLQAVTGKKLGNLNLKQEGALMVNLLGNQNPDTDYAPKLKQLSQIKNSFIHWYEKEESRPNRKLGHITIVIESIDCENLRQDCLKIVEQINKIWEG